MSIHFPELFIKTADTIIYFQKYQPVILTLSQNYVILNTE